VVITLSAVNSSGVLPRSTRRIFGTLGIFHALIGSMVMGASAVCGDWRCGLWACGPAHRILPKAGRNTAACLRQAANSVEASQKSAASSMASTETIARHKAVKPGLNSSRPRDNRNRPQPESCRSNRIAVRAVSSGSDIRSIPGFSSCWLEKREAWHGTLQLFPASRRTQVKEMLGGFARCSSRTMCCG